MKPLSCLTTAWAEVGKYSPWKSSSSHLSHLQVLDPKCHTAPTPFFLLIMKQKCCPLYWEKSSQVFKFSFHSIASNSLIWRQPAVWSQALTGKGSGPSGTKPWGQKSATVNVETAAFDERARYVENAAEPSHTATFISGEVLCRKRRGRCWLFLPQVLHGKVWISMWLPLIVDPNIWKRMGGKQAGRNARLGICH